MDIWNLHLSQRGERERERDAEMRKKKAHRGLDEEGQKES